MNRASLWAARISVLVAYLIASVVAAGLVSGGGHGTTGPLWAAGSWVSVLGMTGIHLSQGMDISASTVTLINAVVVFLFLIMIPLYYWRLLSLLNHNWRVTSAATVLHCCGCILAMHIADAGVEQMYKANVRLGHGVALALLTSFLLMELLIRFVGLKLREKGHIVPE